MLFSCAQQSPAGGGATEAPRLAPGAQRMLQNAMAPPPPPRSPAPVPPPLPPVEGMDDSEAAPENTTNETGAAPALVAFDEDPAYLLFHYPQTVSRDDRVLFSEGGLLAEVNIMFMKLGVENIASRHVAIKVESGTGPATIHGFSKTECRAFIQFMCISPGEFLT